jgi:hypothetical protein
VYDTETEHVNYIQIDWPGGTKFTKGKFVQGPRIMGEIDVEKKFNHRISTDYQNNGKSCFFINNN